MFEKNVLALEALENLLGRKESQFICVLCLVFPRLV